MITKRRNSGFSILEVIIGLAILSISFFVMTSTTASFTRVSAETTRTLQASYLLEEGAEAVRSIRDKGWTTGVLPLQTDYWYGLGLDTGVASSSWRATTTNLLIGGVFLRRFKLNDVYRNANDDIADSGTIDPGTLKVTIEVAWQGVTLATTTKTVTTYITNYFND